MTKRVVSATLVISISICPHRVHDVNGADGGLGQAALQTSRRQAPDEDVLILAVLLHPDPVAQQCPAGKGARRVNGDNANGQAFLAKVADKIAGQRALAGTR
jgi:hypothetical protein